MMLSSGTWIGSIMYSFAHMSRPKDQLHTAVDPQLAAVQAEVIICSHPPNLVGNVLIVAGTLFVPAFDVASGSIGGNSMFFDDANGPVRQFASNENMETILTALQDVVGAPPHDDAGPLLRQLLNQLGLIGVDLIWQGHIVSLIGVIGRVAPR